MNTELNPAHLSESSLDSALMNEIVLNNEYIGPAMGGSTSDPFKARMPFLRGEGLST